MMTQSHPDGNKGGIQTCPVCGYNQTQDAVFCARCGTAFDFRYDTESVDSAVDTGEYESLSPRPRPALTQQCSVCGELNRPGALLCEACGTNLSTGQRLPISTRIIGDDLERFADVSLEGSDTVDIEDLDKGGSLSGTSIFKPDMILRIQIDEVEMPMLLRMAPNHPIIFGRQDANDQPIDIDLGVYSGYAKGISRIHAAMELINNRLELMDIGSSNGTYLNGNRLEPNQRNQLRDGDEIHFSRLAMVIYFEKRINK